MAVGRKVFLSFQTGAFLLSLTLLSGYHYRVDAQDAPPQQERWMISNEDAVQDSDIAAINKHLEHTDNQLDRVDARSQDTENKLSALSAQAQFVGLILTFLTGGSIVFNVKKWKAV